MGMRWRRRSASDREAIFELKEGSLYPALHRLERQKLLAIDVARGRRPAAKILRADRGGPHRASRASGRGQSFAAGRQRRARHEPGRSPA